MNDTKNKTKLSDVSPNHYKVGGIETWDYLCAKLSPTQLAGYAKGNVIKYISRADHKGNITDLKKAAWYLNKLIEELESYADIQHSTSSEAKDDTP